MQTQSQSVGVKPQKAPIRGKSSANDAKNLSLNIVDQLDRRSTALASIAKKAKEVSVRVKHVANSSFSRPSELSGLLDEIKSLGPDVTSGVDAKCIEALEAEIASSKVEYKERFLDALKAACSSNDIPIRALTEDTFAVGPVEVEPDYKKESATLKYSKVALGAPIALTPQLIVEKVKETLQDLQGQIKDVNTLAADFEEAIRVAISRSGKWPKGAELRADLPAVYRELAMVRQFAKKNSKPYSLAKFVFEFKGLVQSDWNAEASKVFTPEPAVIENARDPKKSIFVPNDLLAGFGEGTYFQALCLRPRS